MIPLWRILRNRHTRRLYDALASVGVTGSRMVEFVAETEPEKTTRAEHTPEDVDVAAFPATHKSIESFELDFLIPVEFIEGEWVVVAIKDDEAVGRALVSAGQHPFVETLGTKMSFDGAYVRKVYVDRGWRGEGIAKALVSEALTVAREEFGAEKAFALIATDNRPSQRVFESNGFEKARRHDYVRFFGFERRQLKELGENG